jgi:eukaryotic-like serine/threonine-protein kinase
MRVLCPRCGLGLAVGWKWRLCPACLARTGFETGATVSTEAVAVAAGDGFGGDAGMAGGALPRTFGRYVLHAELGRGGQGVVFEARERGLDRRVAVKVLRGAAMAGPEALARFEAEARAAAAVRHPNLVAVHEVGAWDGQPYYAMDFIAGRDLAALVADGPVAPRQAAEWVRAVALAVQAAHDQGVLHRDLKPSNILVDEAGTPYVTDFGLAKRWAETAPLTLTLSHQVLGSPHYMPPEQVSSGVAKIGPTADVYGLGAILYHLLTGRPPFEGPSLPEVLRLVVDEVPLSPRRLRPEVALDLEIICLKALRKESAARYGSAQALAEDLDRWLAGRPVVARPVSPAERLGLWCRRRPALSGALALCGLLLVTLAVGGPLAAVSIQRGRLAAERLEAERREQLQVALLAQARATRLTERPGQREQSLLAVAEAVRIRSGSEARREAIAALALPDVRPWRQLNTRGVPVAFDRNLRRYATNDVEGNLHIRDLADDRPVHFLPRHQGPDLPDGRAGLYGFGFDPEGTTLGASYVNHQHLAWRLDDQPTYEEAKAAGGTAMQLPVAHRPRVVPLPWGAQTSQSVPGTGWFAVDAADGRIRFYHPDTFEEVHRLEGPLSLARCVFSPEGQRFAEATASVVTIRDLRTSVTLARWDTGELIEGYAWHPDGLQLVTWSRGGRFAGGMWDRVRRPGRSLPTRRR